MSEITFSDKNKGDLLTHENINEIKAANDDNNSRIVTLESKSPTTDQKDALDGASSPSADNQFLTKADYASAIIYDETDLVTAITNTVTGDWIIASDITLTAARTIPSGVTLEFINNAIIDLNGFILIGTNTIIKAGSVKIFEYDRTAAYIDGTWDVKHWNCRWFGAIPDGTATRATFSEGVLTANSSGLEMIYDGYDNYDPIQKALDTAYKVNVKDVYLPIGRYTIEDTLQIGWSGYHNIRFYGDGAARIGSVNEGGNSRTIIQYNGVYAAISVNSGYGASIYDLYLVGHSSTTYRNFFAMWQNTTVYAPNPEDWNSEWVNYFCDNYGLNQFSPYAGIVTDAYINYDSELTMYPLPTLPAYQATFITQSSTRFQMDRVDIFGFTLGFGLEIGNYEDNAEFYDFRSINISSCVYGVSTGSNQARNTGFYDSNLGNNYIALSNDVFGLQNGGFYGNVMNCSFDGCYKIFDLKADISPITFTNCYSENGYMVGRWGALSANQANLTLNNCTFRPVAEITNPLGIPSYYLYGSNISLINSNISITSGEGSYVLPIISERWECLNSRFSNSTGYESQMGIFPATASDESLIRIENSKESLINSRGLPYNKYDGNYKMYSRFVEGDMILSDLVYDDSSNIFTATNTYNNRPYAGDIIGNRYGSHGFAVVLHYDISTKVITAMLINGFRLDGSTYIPHNDLTTGLYHIYRTSYRWFDRPLIVNSVEDNTLYLNEFDSNLVVGNLLYLLFKDGVYSPSITNTVITAVDEDNSTVTIYNSSGMDFTHNKIYGYIMENGTNDFWSEYTDIQTLITTYNS